MNGMIGISGRVVEAGIYHELVRDETVRDALNYQDDVPSPLALMRQIEEAVQRVEGLTSMVLPTSTWEYRIEHEFFLQHGTAPGLFSLHGLFPAGADVSVQLVDDAGTQVPHTATVQGIGEEIHLFATGTAFTDFDFPADRHPPARGHEGHAARRSAGGNHCSGRAAY